MTGPQRLHREPDPRTRRILVAALTAAALLVGGALTVVGMRVQQVQLAYRLDEARLQHARAQGNVRQLAVRVEAKRLGQETEAGLAERPHLPGDGRRELPPEPDERPPTRQGSPHLARRQAEDRREPGRDAHGITDAPGLDEE